MPEPTWTVEEVLAMFDEGSRRHRHWHYLVPESISDYWAWCLDCLRLVPNLRRIDGPEAGTGFRGPVPATTSRENFPPASGTVTPLVASGDQNESDPLDNDGTLDA